MSRMARARGRRVHPGGRQSRRRGHRHRLQALPDEKRAHRDGAHPPFHPPDRPRSRPGGRRVIPWNLEVGPSVCTKCLVKLDRWTIASYWAQRDEWFFTDIEHPHCFACGMNGGYPDHLIPQRRWNNAKRLHRGHLVNRARDGLDQVQNLVPLCGFCNRFMPIFDAEHADDAIDWVLAGGAIVDIEERMRLGARP